MGTIVFQENLETNLAFEEVLGTQTALHTAVSNNAVFRNLAEGPYQYADVRFFGSAILATQLPGGTYYPTSGTITSGTFQLSSDIISLLTIDSTPGNLVSFFSALRGYGALAAFDALFAGNDTITGQSKNDHLTTYGLSSTDTLNGGGGDDILWNRGQADAVMIGGTGSDVFRLATGATNVDVVGGNTDGTGAAGDRDTLVIEGTGIGFLSIASIDALRFASSDGQGSVTFRHVQVGDGLLSRTLSVEGSASQGDAITFTRFMAMAADLDLSGWRFSNWGRLDQTVTFRFDDDAGTPRADRVVGTEVDDTILMGAGADTLSGGRGADLLSGGDGDDVFIFKTGDVVAGERVIGGGGVDTIHLSGNVDMSLMRVSGIERIAFDGATRLWFNDSIPQAPLAVAGDAQANEIVIRLFSNASIDLRAWTFVDWSAADTLRFEGSLGSDVFFAPGASVTADAGYGDDALTGGAGADLLSGGSGNDTLDGGVGNDRLLGGYNSDLVSGSDGNDVLSGGSGNDTLTGGSGKDNFLFDAKPAKTNLDRVTDFRVADDTIQLARGVFTKIAKTGTLKKAAFHTGAKAHDADDRIVYNKKTGFLSYDPDGSGRAAAVAFAKLGSGLALTEKDFFVL